jgi:zinc protease
VSAPAVRQADGEPLVLVESSRALPLVSMTIATRAGATSDPAGKEGLLRLACRLVRRTGAGLTTEALDERIDALGGSMSVDVGHSAATFHGTVITRSLEPFADLLVGVLSRPSLADTELAKLQRETVAELIDARDHDRELGQRWFRQRLFGTHPFARPVGGTTKSVESVTSSEVRTTFERSLCANNLVFAFAGDVDEDRAAGIAKTIAASLPPGRAIPDDVPEPTMTPGRRLVVVDKPERTQTQILIGCLGTHPHDVDHVALHVGNTIFGGTFTARLMNEVRSKRGWSYGAYSSLPYDRHRRGFSLWTFPKAADAAPCIGLELELLQKWWSEGVTAKELAWAQRYLVRSHAFAIDTPSKRVGQILDERLYDLPPGYHENYVEHVRSVTRDQVNDAIRARVTPEDLLVTVVGTASEIAEPIKRCIDGLAATEIIPFETEG